MLGHVKQALRRHVFSATGPAFVDRFNFYNRIRWKLPIVLRWDSTSSTYMASSGGSTVHFARNERVWVYAHGVDDRLRSLERIYMLQHVPLRARDWVLDCGANVGEFSVCIRNIAHARVIAVEPESCEALCISLNVPDVIAVINKVLWDEAGSIDFYSKNDSADSSVFQPANFAKKVTLPATTLADIFTTHGIERLRLLKLEAEGAEPEVLEGGGEYLDKIDYVTADVGPERGLAQETTLVQVANRLYSRGFELVSVNTPRLICLFRNKRALCM